MANSSNDVGVGVEYRQQKQRAADAIVQTPELPSDRGDKLMQRDPYTGQPKAVVPSLPRRTLPSVPSRPALRYNRGQNRS